MTSSIGGGAAQESRDGRAAVGFARLDRRSDRPMTQISSDRIASIEARKHELAQAMARADLAPDEFVRLSKDYAAIEPVADAAREVRRLRAELEVLNGMVHDPSAEPELKEMAAAEAEEIRHKLPHAERALALKLLPRDAADDRAAMLEVRAGTGGDEAALFAGDLLRMYQRFAETQGWRFELISRQRVGAWRLQGSDRLDQRRGRVRQAEVRKRRPPRAARAGDGKRRAHPHLGGDGRGAPGGRGCRRPDRRQGPADRRLSLVGSGRSVGQHDRQRGPHHPPADRPGRHPAGREVAAQEQGQGAEGAAHAAVRAGARAAGERARRRAQVHGRFG